MKLRIFFALAGLALGALGCGSVVSDAPPNPEPSRCPSGRFGGAMVEVPSLDAGSYCIDATEVTNAQYAAFLASSPTLDDWPALCRNLSEGYLSEPSFTTFTPTTWPVAADHDDHPVVNINWCAAATFCAANGKRLCGRVGGGTLGGETDVAWKDRVDPHRSEWANACSGGGTKPYAYGASFEAGRCAPTGYWDTDHTAPVGNPSCEGGWPGLFDLGGGVAEFIDDCVMQSDLDPAPYCNPLGVGNGEDGQPACEREGWMHIPVAVASVGVRCCADGPPSP